jgi:hypothetical protein
MMDNPTGQVFPDGDKTQHRRPHENQEPPETRGSPGRISRSREKNNRTNNRKRRSLSKFLLESDIKPVIFVGKCVQQFGWGAVIGFCLGAAGVYGYAFAAKSLPLVTLAQEQSKNPPTTGQTPPANQTRWLHGVIKSNDRLVTEDIEIGVLATRAGPFQSGVFRIQVPESDRYQITLWNQGYQRMQLVELRPDSDGNVHDVLFPSGGLSFQASNKRNLPPNTDVGNAQIESASSQLSARSTRPAASQSRSSVATH